MILNKKLALSFLILSLVSSSLSVIPAFAVTPTPPLTKAERQQLNLQQQMDRIRTAANHEIDVRVTSLNDKIAKVKVLKNLSDAQKTDFTSQFQSRIDALTALKTKIGGDTDLITLKADRKSITADYRIFAIFEPRLMIDAQADTIITRANTLLSKTTKTDAQTKLHDAITQANAAIDKVAGLTPASYPATQILKDARALLKTANTDIAAARKIINTK